MGRSASERCSSPAVRALVPQLFGGFQQAACARGPKPVALAVGLRRALELFEAEADARIEAMTAPARSAGSGAVVPASSGRSSTAPAPRACRTLRTWRFRARPAGPGHGPRSGRRGLFDRLGLRQRIERTFARAGGDGLAARTWSAARCDSAWAPKRRPTQIDEAARRILATVANLAAGPRRAGSAIAGT